MEPSREEKGVSAPETPRFVHDCDACVFLGRCDVPGLDGYDLYFCPKDGRRGTLLARYGSEGSEYASGLHSAELHPGLAVAKRRAIEQGLLKEEDSIGERREEAQRVVTGLDEAIQKAKAAVGVRDPREMMNMTPPGVPEEPAASEQEEDRKMKRLFTAGIMIGFTAGNVLWTVVHLLTR